MLVNKISSVRNDMDVVDTLRHSETEKSNIVKKNNTFFSSYALLKESVQSYIMISERTDFKVKDDTLKLIRNTMDNAKGIFDSQMVSRHDAFKKDSESIISKLTSEWEQYIKERNTPVLDSLNILKQVAEPSKQIAIRNLQSDIKKCETWPVNADLLDNYFKACHQADEYRQSMNFDDEIETFLRKVSNRMATLDDITPKVMEWIEKEEFKTKIGLSIK